MCNVDIICEQDGVVRHHRFTGRQNASCCVTNDVQDTVIHQEVVHQQLNTDTMGGKGSNIKKISKTELQPDSTADWKAYPKLFHPSLRCLWVVPEFDHRHCHRLIKDDINTIHLQGNQEMLSSLDLSQLTVLCFFWSTSSPFQVELGLTTCVCRRRNDWLHLLIYLESLRHRSHCPVHWHCLEKL